jgi:hypothetical protein
MEKRREERGGQGRRGEEKPMVKMLKKTGVGGGV